MAAWSWAVVCLAGWAKARVEAKRQRATVRGIGLAMECSRMRGVRSSFLRLGEGDVAGRRGGGFWAEVFVGDAGSGEPNSRGSRGGWGWLAGGSPACVHAGLSGVKEHVRRFPGIFVDMVTLSGLRLVD